MNRALTASALLLCCHACTDRAPGPPPGAAARVPPPPLAFPTAGLQPGLMRLERAFPALTFQRPVFLTHAGDGTDRIFVVEQTGAILVFPNRQQATSPTVFLDLAAKVRANGEEQGLLGLAFHPAYRTNGLFYVHYIRRVSGRDESVLAEYRTSAANPDRADPNSERVVLTLAQPFSNHNGGMLAFGPDGYLYASFGDGGGTGNDPGNHGQNPGTLLSTIIRIDPTDWNATRSYGVPKDNAGRTIPGARPEVHAFGLRNPWRFSFDRLTGALWLGDVGSWRAEEINAVRPGGNYGWSVYEGSTSVNNPSNLPASAFDAPLHHYDQTLGRSVIGGYVYRGVAHPPLRGAYLFADYVSGIVQGLVRQPAGPPITALVALGSRISSFGEDEAGELYLASLDGTLHRLAPRVSTPPFPLRLSETGIFADTAALLPNPGLLEYEVNAPLWSDGAVKRRWLAIPRGAAIDFDADEAWRFPLGTVAVKHFELELRVGDPGSRTRLETRVLVVEDGGLGAYTYVWNAAQTDADLLTSPAGLRRSYTVRDPAAPGGSRTQEWQFPSMSECLQCHTAARGGMLGVRTRQLNVPPHLAGTRPNPLDELARLGWFQSPIGSAATYGHYVDPADAGQPLALRARSYLAANCAHCHLPGGPVPSPLDLRFRTPDGQMNAIDVRPLHSWLGMADPYIIAKSDKTRSTLWQRMRRLDQVRMPRIGSGLVDDAGVDLVGRWIDALR